MRQVFILKDGTKKIIDSVELVKNLVVEASKIDVFHPVVSTEDCDKRLAVCNDCDKFCKVELRCKQCGCYMKAKARISTATCPLNKWEK